VLAYWKAGGGLTHVVFTEAGHMVPRDAPVTMRWVLERWLAGAVMSSGGTAARPAED
jgi:vitellogenic carboxypeptidase-like protein